MDIASVVRPVGPLLIGITQVAALATAVEVQPSLAGDGGTEVAVAGHPDVHDVGVGQRNATAVRFIIG